MGSVKIANGKITLCAERGKAITFVCNWKNGRRVFVWQCVPGRHAFQAVFIHAPTPFGAIDIREKAEIPLFLT